MAGIYKIGFPDSEPHEQAKAAALATVRETDTDEVTAGPEIVQTPEHAEAGEFLVRIVTGVEDPPRPAPGPASRVLGRMAELPPEKLAALNRLLDQIEG